MHGTLRHQKYLHLTTLKVKIDSFPTPIQQAFKLEPGGCFNYS